MRRVKHLLDRGGLALLASVLVCGVTLTIGALAGDRPQQVSAAPPPPPGVALAPSGCTPAPVATATPTSTPTDTPTATFVAPTATPTDTPTATFVAPTATPTDTPTATFVAPTATPTDTPTATFVAPTATPTDTPTAGAGFRSQGVSAQAPARVAVLALTTWTLGTGQPGTTQAPFNYGTRPLTPIMGDWNGDGLITVGTFQAGTFYLNDQNDNSSAELVDTYGDPRGYPVAGDFDGNGCDDVAVYRNGTWQVHYLGPGAPANASFTLPAPFGQSSWPSTVPVAGDWNGDGIDGIGTYNRATATWVLKNTVGTGAPDFPSFGFGVPGSSVPVVGDWDGDGTDSPGFRTGTTWTVRTTGVGVGSTTTFVFGTTNAIPLTW